MIKILSHFISSPCSMLHACHFQQNQTPISVFQRQNLTPPITHLFNTSIKTKPSPLTSSSDQYFHLQILLPVTQRHGISSGVHRMGATQGASSSPIRIGPHQKTPHPPLVLHGLPRFLRTRHCVAREAAGIAVGVGGADPGNPAGGEVLGDGGGGGGGGGELRGVSVRVRGRGRDQTVDELPPHIPQRLSGPLDGVRSENVSPLSDALHTPPYASCLQ
ncbi:uncharacterized protein HKW66_Vig0161930 [Vigna angularis]|uniref:Uncharacterized protein n=1 Tax=Phaseolus angularis TaxID=3914 RepID=A0A8T0JL18_PHAAN|nr:uncharacterized protein HKW66_Vig0161930 [Vigna angularis]